MTTCTVVGLSWAILAVLYADKANINAFAPYNLSYKPYSGGSLNTIEVNSGNSPENIKYIASYITPVPGGVGPMTVAMLLKNVIKSTKISR